MPTAIEKKFDVEIVYNGVSKALQVDPQESIAVVLQKAIAEFRITQNPHLFSLFRQDGSVVLENESVECAGIRPHEVLLLRPNAVKGGNGPLRLAANILQDTFRTLRECGRGECECVAYLTGPSDSNLVNAVEHPVHWRSPFGYEVNDGWITGFWKRLAGSKRSIKVQVHSHPDEAFHSATDDKWPIVSQAGFVSIVIPRFAVGEASLDGAWVGRLQKDGRWQSWPSAVEAVVLT